MSTISSKTFLGLPINFNGIKIYPPTVKEVVASPELIGQYSLLTQSDDDMYDRFHRKRDSQGQPLEVPTPLMFLCSTAYAGPQANAQIVDAFQSFIHEPVVILPESLQIYVGDLEKELLNIKEGEDYKPRILDESNFADFQNALRSVMGDKPVEKPDPNEHPRIREMKAKARYRDRIKAKREAQKQKNGDAPTLGTQLAAMCCMGLGLNPLNIGDISYASVKVLMTLFQQRDTYDKNYSAILAGAKGVSLDSWIK